MSTLSGQYRSIREIGMPAQGISENVAGKLAITAFTGTNEPGH
jgi:hypothetical protein